MPRQLAIAVACAVVVASTAAVIALASNDRASAPTVTELRALEDRIWKAVENGELARAGVYLSPAIARNRRCVVVWPVNPTTPNIAYLQRRFGPPICVRREPFDAELSDCTDALGPTVRTGRVSVPTITGIRIESVQRLLVARDLRFTYGCLDDVKDAPVPLAPSSPDRLAVIVDQCPRAGERVSRRTAVSYRAIAMMPGGYRWYTGTLPTDDEVDSSRRPVCGNGRDVFSSRNAPR